MWALRPAKPLGVLSRHPCRNPKPLSRGEGLCMLCWLCIVQSLWAYTPGVRAGAECGVAALTKQGCLQSATQSHYARTHKDSQTKPLHDATAQMAVNAQMQWHKWLTTRIGAMPQTPFSKIYRFFDRLSGTFSVYRFFVEGCGFYTGCGLNYLSNIHLLKAAIIF